MLDKVIKYTAKRFRGSSAAYVLFYATYKSIACTDTYKPSLHLHVSPTGDYYMMKFGSDGQYTVIKINQSDCSFAGRH